MGRPNNKETKLKKCTGKCKRELAEQNFYNSTSSLFDGKVPICKKCIKELINYDDINTIYNVLQTMDIPFLKDYWSNCLEKKGDTFGNYIRQVNSLPQIKNLHWKDSKFEKSDSMENTGQGNTYSFDEAEKDLLRDFRPTKDMLIRWGTKYIPEQYIKLENFYREMKIKNTIETPQEEDYLKKLAVISMKMDEELEVGNYSQAKQLGDLFSKYMADSKFRAMDKTEADKTGGIRNFSTIYAEVESDGFIPPWEYYRKLKNISQDIIDKVIMHLENFTLRLNRVEKMTEPPVDTPKISQEEIKLGDTNE